MSETQTKTKFPAQVYHLGSFPEIVKGVAMAKCSRSPNTFLEDAMACDQERAEDFNERVVAGYGHESVAEMAVGSPVLQDVSMLVSETFLDVQTGHYQGKSSRYVVYTRDKVVNPFAHDPETETVYLAGIDALFDAYEALYEPVHSYVESQIPGATTAVKKARTLDALRGLLPLGCQTNFGSRLTGRDIAKQVRTLSSHPLAEAKQVGADLKKAGIDELGPALVKYAEAHPLYSEYDRIKLPEDLERETPAGPYIGLDDGVYHYQPQHVIRALVLERTGKRITVGQAAKLTFDTWEEINKILAKRERRQDPLPKWLRAARYRFQIVADFGVWKDLRRHRRNEIWRAPFTAQLGYQVPDDVAAVGPDAVEKYCYAMDLAKLTHAKLTSLGYPEEAQYAVAQGHLQHWVVDMDLEQVYYICELRTAPQGHISYRRIARGMYELVREQCPMLVQHMLVHPVDGIGVHT